jgi:dTDP-glucose pyrophosphorylase
MLSYAVDTPALAGMWKLFIIVEPWRTARFEHVPGSISHRDLAFSYAAQPAPDNFAQAFPPGKSFIAGDLFAHALGDDAFCGYDVPHLLPSALERVPRPPVSA